MKGIVKYKANYILLFILFLNSSKLVSQIWETNLGIESIKTGGNYINYDYIKTNFESQVLHYVISFGANIPIYRITQEVVLGSQLNANISFTCTDRYGYYLIPDFGFALPGYLTLRYGGGSYDKSDKIFGCGFGIGYQLQAFSTEVSGTNDDDKGLGLFGNPMFMAEIAFDRSHKIVLFNNIKLRFERSIGTYREDYSFTYNNLKYDYFYNCKQNIFTLVLCY